MAFPDVRRLAALDMHGTAGTRRRRRLVSAEFFVSASGGLGLGIWVAIAAASAGWRWFGGWMAGVGVNYAVLACHAVLLSRPGALDAELAGTDVPAGLRRYSVRQFWLVVPLLFAVLALWPPRGAASSPDNAS